MRLTLLAAFALLTACAPTVDCLPDTAFAGEIVAARTSTLQVAPDRSGPLTVLTSGETRVLSARGEPLALQMLTPGTRVYVRGVLEDRHVSAQEVRVLGSQR